jgi:hypothetical protein
LPVATIDSLPCLLYSTLGFYPLAALPWREAQ